jgi:hypothetical protein
MKRTPIRRISAKRAREMKEYTRLRAEFMAARPTCERCSTRASKECHHKAKRGINYLNVSTWAALCHACHRKVHENPSWARENGLLI